MVEVTQDHAAGLFSGTDEVIEKITGHKPMGLEEFSNYTGRVAKADKLRV